MSLFSPKEMAEMDELTRMVVEYGRHQILFDQLQEGLISQEKFDQREEEILTEMANKTKRVECGNCNPAQCFLFF